MLKVVIADDEERVCKLVQMLGDWDALGMEVAGTAANGIEALTLVESLNPDILITDIRMPGCDGLELIEKAKAISPCLEIILISGHAQFEYAQTAIRFNVGDYILKPISKDTLNSTLEKLGARCSERISSTAAVSRLRQDNRKSNELLRDRLLEDLIRHNTPEFSRELLESKYGFIAPDGLFQAVIIKIDCPPQFFRSPSADIFIQKVHEIFESMLSGICQTYVFAFHNSTGYGLLNYKANEQIRIRRLMRELLKQLEAHRFGGVEVSLSIGKAVDHAGDLPVSMQNAQIAIMERFIEGTGRLLESDLTDLQPKPWKLLTQYDKLAERAIDTLSVEEANTALDRLRGDIEKTSGLYGHTVFELCLAAGKMFALRLSLDEDSDAVREFEDICSLQGSVVKLFDCLRDFQKKQLEETRERLESEAMRPIRIAKQYIARHFNEQISLDDVCAATGFSASYFSTLFKKETGEGFSKYLARVRIERAKELLRDTNLPVSEICELVGYGDIKHFTGTFKKTTCLSPGQYRKLYG